MEYVFVEKWRVSWYDVGGGGIVMENEQKNTDNEEKNKQKERNRLLHNNVANSSNYIYSNDSKSNSRRH